MHVSVIVFKRITFEIHILSVKIMCLRFLSLIENVSFLNPNLFDLSFFLFKESVKGKNILDQIFM